MNALYKLSFLVQSAIDYKKLPHQIVGLIDEEFNALLVGMFFVDKLNNCAILKAATGKGGEILLKRGLKFSLSPDVQNYDYVTQSINNDVICATDKDGIFYSKATPSLQFVKLPDVLFGFAPFLPPTRFVISIPLHIHQKVFALLYLEHSETLKKESVVEVILPIARKIETLYEADL